MSLLQVLQVTRQEAGGQAVQNVSFTQQKLQKIAIAGETGSGKTTLLKIIGGIISPDTGEVLFENKRLKRIPEEKLIPGHPGIAYLNQQFDLPHFLTVEQVLVYANTLPDNEAETDEATKALYDVCRVTHLLKRQTSQLSGGERQRIALAMLLVASPRLLLLDEPFSNLDMIHKNLLKAVINDIVERLNVTCILVSHDPLDTLSWADEIIVMKHGQIIQQGTPGQVYSQPVDEYTAGLFGKYNLITAAHAKYLLGLHGFNSGGKNMLIRPEGFTIAGKEHGALRGTVGNIVFYGSYYEADILLAGSYSVKVKLAECNLVAGSTIYINPPAENIWYL